MNEDEIYINFDHSYMVSGTDFFVIHKIPFCIGSNITEKCKVYKFNRTDEMVEIDNNNRIRGNTTRYLSINGVKLDNSSNPS